VDQVKGLLRSEPEPFLFRSPIPALIIERPPFRTEPDPGLMRGKFSCRIRKIITAIKHAIMVKESNKGL